jgi:hypothetical protein
MPTFLRGVLGEMRLLGVSTFSITHEATELGDRYVIRW